MIRIRLRIFIGAAAGLALAALAWRLADIEAPVAMLSSVVPTRSSGVALLGVAMVAAGLMFYVAMAQSRTAESPPALPRTGEFRRGFAAASGATRPTNPPPRLRPSEKVVAMRRTLAEQARLPAARAEETPLPEDFQRLRQPLHARAARLRARYAVLAKRRFLNGGENGHERANE